MLELARYIHMKSDERILGDGDFTQSVLDEATERLEARCRLQAQGYDLEKITTRVSSALGIDTYNFMSPNFLRSGRREKIKTPGTMLFRRT